MNICPRLSKSFTLIELLITISILAILSATMLPQFIGYSKERNAERAASAFTSDLLLAKNKALSGAVQIVSGNNIATHWGIRINCQSSGDYSLGYYIGSSFVNVSDKKLPGLFTFGQTGSGSSSDLCLTLSSVDLKFGRLTGLLEYDYVEVKISNTKQSRIVKIYKSGSFELSL